MRRVTVIAVATAAFATIAGVGSAAPFALTTSKLGMSAVTTPIMFPDSVTITNKGGGHLGKPENGDIFTFVFSRQLDEPSMCSTWLNTDPTWSAKLTWSIIDGGSANDTFAVTTYPAATCANGFHLGTVDLGNAGYNLSTTDIDFNGSNTALTVGATTSTLVVTLNGQKNGTAGTVSGGGAATWAPDPAVTDRNNRNCGANLSMTSSTTQF